MKITVFGGSGFLGSHVTDSLVNEGHDVKVFDIKPYLFNKNPQVVLGDILNNTDVDSAVKDADVVYNFAGIASLNNASSKPVDTVKLNVLGNCFIMDACIKYKVKRYIYASTVYVHSDKGGFYRCSKQASEIYIEEYSRKYGLAYTILRYGSLYGLRSDSENSIYNFIKEAISKGTMTYRGTGDELREYIHVKDAANLSVQILEEQYVDKHLIITGSIPYKVSVILETIREIIGKPISLIFDGEEVNLHYNVTPYVYKPQYSYKLTSNFYMDIGQGLFEVVEQINNEQNGG